MDPRGYTEVSLHPGCILQLAIKNARASALHQEGFFGRSGGTGAGGSLTLGRSISKASDGKSDVQDQDPSCCDTATCSCPGSAVSLVRTGYISHTQHFPPMPRIEGSIINPLQRLKE